MSRTVEVTTEYRTVVDELTQAFAFVMEHLDQLGDEPSIEIEPCSTWIMDEEDSESVFRPSTHTFEVIVSGTVRKTVDVQE